MAAMTWPGSVYEWCTDWYLDSYYAETPTKNPKAQKRHKTRNQGGSVSKAFFRFGHTRKSEQPGICSIWLWVSDAQGCNREINILFHDIFESIFTNAIFENLYDGVYFVDC